MTQNQDLQSMINKLQQLTGVKMEIHAEGTAEESAAMEQLTRLYQAYKEKYDKNHFLQNLLFRTMPINELTESAAHFHMTASDSYALLLLETKQPLDDSVTLLLKHLFPSTTKTHFVPVSESSLAIIKPVDKKEFCDEYLQHISCSILDTLSSELYVDGRIACGPLVSHLSGLCDAFQKTSLTLKVGRTFYSEQPVYLHSHLGIGGLLYQLPASARKEFLFEVFHTDQVSLEPELLDLVNRFIGNNLNISETARQLYMHRNTLIYRLDSIEQMTGLNLREFEDAMTFKIALMLLNYNE